MRALVAPVLHVADVGRAVGEGATDAQLAQRLAISIRTAQTYVGNILRNQARATGGSWSPGT